METAVMARQWLSSTNARLLPDFLGALNVDFRKNFSLNNLHDLDVGNPSLEFLSFFLFNINLRFESPLLNLKIRRSFVDFSNNIYVVGFLSNFNYDFEHVSPRDSRQTFNRYFGVQNRLSICSILGGGFVAQQVSSSNISNLTRAETGLTTVGAPGFISFFFGQPEFVFSARRGSTGFHLYHHMEDSFLKTLLPSLNVFLPTRFYFEKVASYINNAHNFFNTSYHFSYKLPNTKEDFKIVAALLEFVSPNSYDKNTISSKLVNKVNSPLSEDRPYLEFLSQLDRGYFIGLPRRGSMINNFYNSSVISRVSSVLSLCSSRLVQINDYSYASIN
jgi:hypothetical protein